ncbi:hypothetical protein [Flavobacterium sp.]|uniref:hypothetical protein n=1 Tax=Flavobacterium sp. TaxID=239 RepID=UPI00391C01B0
MITSILTNIALALIAIIVLTLFKARASVFNGEFRFNIFWQENRNRWIWTMLMVSFIALVNAYAPDALTSITALVGIELTSSPGAFATLGVLLLTTGKGSMTISKRKAKISKREEKLQP